MRRTSKKSRKRSGSFSPDLPRARLEEIFNELQPREPRLSWRTRNDLLLLLFKILDQGRDTRVRTFPWQIAMLAAALVDERAAQPKIAQVAAIEFYAPDRATDAKFRAYIEKTYTRLRSGKNPARPQLLPVPAELLDLASEKLKRR
jgi:hypothetical protein